MADHFGAIASKEIGSTRAPLVFPQPQPKNGVTFPLTETNDAPTAVYKKPAKIQKNMLKKPNFVFCLYI